ncbi:MAG: helix-turn-helix domain-containing protein [Thiohalocapsa sp.]|jgi:excisionase family DNA binding protein|uniref:helix-turn-helix domain-containing protein n=1 Tax=Thiohalocapsa sp. TaxID=2497641 RepID=UPI0025F1E323|nr:helix-turn-helix domain-containing protein [Thiohalocapsa sp.]MCG6941516.1 helix-turn-helix domain-containing protein [Thiohalocapsa sp.]
MTNPAVSPARQLDNEKEAAAYLKLSPRTLQAWRLRGGGPEYVKLGNAVRYDRAALDRYISERTRRNSAG